MASDSYAEELTCSVCLSIFTDPVVLPCGHSFCRKCITVKPITECPQCRAVLPSADEVKRLSTSHILKSLAEKAREVGQQRPGPAQGAQWLCPEHDEKLKLFCVTDQQVACMICREAEKHDGHKFKPIKEAAASLRKDLDLGLVDVVGQIDTIQNLIQNQGQEITKTKDRSGQLMSQIHRQFETMHQFLRKREDEIINELKIKEEDAVQNMTKSLNAMRSKLTECRELSESWTEILNITDHEQFLKRWTQTNISITHKDLFKPRSNDLHLVQGPLFLGPYQSHLQFFMWKEMLQVVEPRAELLTLRDDNNCFIVSDNRQSFHCAPKSGKSFTNSGFGNQEQGFSFRSSSPYVQSTYGGFFGQPMNYTFNDPTYSCFEKSRHASSNVVVPETYVLYSTDEFSTGQYYWEVEVGLRDYWCLGIKDYFLKYENQKYSTGESKINTELLLINGRFRKIGVYLDCSSKGLSFYDADTMTRIHTVQSCNMSLPVSPYFSIHQKEPDTNPMTVCWY